MKIEEIQKKIDGLLQYRGALDEGEKELFDMLMGYANEVAISIDQANQVTLF